MSNYESFYDEAARNAKRGLDKNIIDIASVEQDSADNRKVNITINLQKDSSENLDPNELRLFKSVLDNAARKYGFQMNYLN